MELWTSMDQGSSSESHCGQERTGYLMQPVDILFTEPVTEPVSLPKWNPKHKIFLSHSGEQKEFVRQLCKDLEAETHQPFFDERSASLMMGERFAPLIFEAARQCLVAIIVLSEAFLTSKWPMLELVEFVKAKRSHNSELKLFPLFYKLSPDDLKLECIESRWKEAWREIIFLALDQVIPLDDIDNQLSLTLCVEALCELRGANGLKFENFSSEVEYREAIVTEISLLVAPDLLDDTSDVIGNERLCKILSGMFVKDSSKDKTLYGIHKLGLYGIGGLGKTTMSRALCMFYYKVFNGRVFHVELGSRPPLDLQKLVLTKLLRIKKDIVEQVHTVHEGRKLLKDHMKRKPVFLVIDNITNDRESQTEALAYLEAGFHIKSMIMITSRSLDIVEELFPSHPNATYCKAMASLNEDEAKLIFLQRSTPKKKLETLAIEEQKILRECLLQCEFSFGIGTRQYHPLALQAMADYYRKHDHLNVLTWKKHFGDLDKLRLSNTSSNIFGVLGLQFSTLALKEKLMFLDLCLYIDGNLLPMYSTKGLKWLVDIHEDTPIAVKFQIQSLKRSGIINITLNEDGEQFITIHDLYREFAKWYVIDGEGSRSPELGCVYHTIITNSLPYVLRKISPSLSQLHRIWLENLTCNRFPSMKVQEWCNVVVLEIHECSNLRLLDLHGLSCLRHLELVGLPKLESFDFGDLQPHGSKEPDGTFESIQHVLLSSLTSLKQLPNFSRCISLKTIQILKCEEFLLEPPRFMGCSQLQALILDWNWQWKVEEFNMDTLTSLTSLELCNQKLVGASPWSRISTLEDVGFLTLTGLGNCSELQNLKLVALPIINLLGLEKLTKLQELLVMYCDFLPYIPDVCALAELKLLSLCIGPYQQFPGVETLLQLRRLALRDCFELTSLPDLDHLPNLTYVELRGCCSLRVMPRVPMGCRLSSHYCAYG